MPLLGDFLSKIKQYVDGIGGYNVSGTVNQNPLPAINVPNNYNDIQAKEYVEQMLRTGSSPGAPQGSVKPSIKDYYNEDKNVVWDYQDKASFPEQYRGSLLDTAKEYDMDPNILASLIASESGGAGYRPDLSGTSGEVGVAQIMPNLFYQQAGFSNPEEYSQALKDVPFSIEQAAIILRDLMDQFDNNPYAALAAYNAGPSGYSERGLGTQYAEDTLKRVGLLQQYLQEQQLAGGY